MKLLSFFVFMLASLSSYKFELIRGPEWNNELVYNHYRLPTSVRPDRYKLKIITNLEDPKDLKFNGQVFIKIQILEDTNNITLHAQNLTIDKSSIYLRSPKKGKHESNAGKKNCVESTATNEQYNYFIMKLCQVAKKGEKYLLTIPFEGSLNTQSTGYFRSSYNDPTKNKTRWLALTRFEPIKARSAFPCFDEPALKAKFTITMGHHLKYIALSNMKVKNVNFMRDKKDSVWSNFAESVQMSTYSVAYALVDYTYIPSRNLEKNNVLIRTWSYPYAVKESVYANDISQEIIKFYENAFNLKLPLKKIDQVPAPNITSEGLGSLGLITYDQSHMFFNGINFPFQRMREVTTTVARKLAHQWFSNLVSVDWWNNVWLSEGMANYFATLAESAIKPAWGKAVVDEVTIMLDVFREDAKKTKYPLSYQVTETSQIDQMFAYAKENGKRFAVLRMLHHFLGEKAFLNGVRSFLKKHAYQSINQDDLWYELNKEIPFNSFIPKNYNIKTIMDSWTLQAGYPLITVTRDYERRTLTITQSPYQLGGNSKATKNQTCWWVPLTYTTKTDLDFRRTSPKSWLECGEGNVSVSLVLSDIPSDTWIVFNVQMVGIYKVKYDKRNWNMLLETLASEDYKTIDVWNRVQLIDDALWLAWGKDEDSNTSDKLVQYLRREREYLVWIAVFYCLDVIEVQNLGNTRFHDFIVQILTPIFTYQQMNVKETSKSENLKYKFKQKVLLWAFKYEVVDFKQRSSEYFAKWRSESDPDKVNPIPMGLRGVTYCVALKYGTRSEFNFLWERYNNTNDVEACERTMRNLGCSRDIRLLQEILNWIYHSSSYKHRRDAPYLFNTIIKSEVGFPVALDFFYNNFPLLKKYYETDKRGMFRMLESIITRMGNRRDYEKLNKFIEENIEYFKEFEGEIRRVVETAELLYHWNE